MSYPQPGAYGYPRQQQGPPPPGYHHHQPYQQPPPRTVVIQHARPGPRIMEKYPAKASLVFGSIQLAIGALLIILNIVGIAIEAYLASGGYAIIDGIFFIITGAFGIVAGHSRTQCPIVAFMVLSILSAIGAITVIWSAAVGAACDGNNNYDDYQCRDWPWEIPDTSQESRAGVNATMSVLGAVEMVIAIISSALCCAGMCCQGSVNPGTVITQGHYSHTAQTATVVYGHPYPQQGPPPPQAQPQPQPGPAGTGGPPPPYGPPPGPNDYTSVVDQK